jgi:4-amino-4-deoxy-L-arabinose transferase-like glycosyltransferase
MKTRAAAVTLSLGALAYIVLGVTRGLSIYDEAIPIVAATRILDGDRPYRDFWVIYPPGQLYLLAGFFKVFGASLIVSRLTSVAAIFGTSVLMYVMARQLRLPVPLALLPAGLWTAAVGAVSGATLGTGIFAALLLGLGSAALFFRFLEESRRILLVMSGITLGFAFLFRHDIAGYLLVAETGLFVATSKLRSRRDVSRALGSLGLHLGAVAGPIAVAVAILLGLGVPAGDLVESLVVYPFTGYASARSLPLPPLVPDIGPLREGRVSVAQYAANLRNGLRFYFPISVLAVSLAVLLARRRAIPAALVHGEGRRVIFVSVVGACLLPYAWIRSDIAHIVPAWFPGLLLFAWLIHQLPRSGRLRSTGLIVAAVWSLVFVWGALVVKADALTGVLGGPPRLALDPPRGAHIVAGPEVAPMQAAIRYVEAVVPPDERIFVGNAQHDNLVLNDVMFYFLAGRRSGTRYHELVPGVATTAEVQTRIVRDLEGHRVRYAVLRTDPGYTPSPEGGAETLDRFIRGNFVRLEVFGNYSVWRKRDERP